jgi:hypothetical protein
MTDVRPGGHRRIDRVLAPTYLDGVESLPIHVLRAKRRELEAEEADLSYLRRLLHGRIDIVQAEQSRRARAAAEASLDGGLAQDGVIDELPRILATPAPRSSRPFTRVRHLGSEPRGDRHRRRVERLVADVDLSDVAARTDDELARVLRTYQSEERLVSDVRVRVQAVLDRCSAELARRYVDGETSVSDLLRPDLLRPRNAGASTLSADVRATATEPGLPAESRLGAERRGDSA